MDIRFGFRLTITTIADLYQLTESFRAQARAAFRTEIEDEVGKLVVHDIDDRTSGIVIEPRSSSPLARAYDAINEPHQKARLDKVEHPVYDYNFALNLYPVDDGGSDVVLGVYRAQGRGKTVIQAWLNRPQVGDYRYWTLDVAPKPGSVSQAAWDARGVLWAVVDATGDLRAENGLMVQVYGDAPLPMPTLSRVRQTTDTWSFQMRHDRQAFEQFWNNRRRLRVNRFLTAAEVRVQAREIWDADTSGEILSTYNESNTIVLPVITDAVIQNGLP